MRALRDFNLPKIVTSDVPIFLGLISDLFPLLDISRKRDQQLEQHVRQAIRELRLQPEENFILKVRLKLKMVAEGSSFENTTGHIYTNIFAYVNV